MLASAAFFKVVFFAVDNIASPIVILSGYSLIKEKNNICAAYPVLYRDTNDTI